VAASNIGCSPMFSWCPPKIPMEFFKWQRRGDYHPDTHKCAYLLAKSSTVLSDVMMEVHCFGPKAQQFICMSK